MKRKDLTKAERDLNETVKRTKRVYAIALSVRPSMEKHVGSLNMSQHHGSGMVPLNLRENFLALNLKSASEVETVAIEFSEFILALTNGSRDTEHYLEMEKRALEPLFEVKKGLCITKFQHERLVHFKKFVQSMVTCCPVDWIDQLVYCEYCGSDSIKFNLIDIHKKSCKNFGCTDVDEQDFLALRFSPSPSNDLDMTTDEEGSI